MIIAGVKMKNDHRVTVTKKMITESFLELIKEKPLAAITVKELCEKAHINRATFYAHYENIYDLADEIKRGFIGDIVNTVTEFSNDDPLGDMIKTVCRCIAQNRDSCEIIFGRNADPGFAEHIVELVRGRYITLWKECRACADEDMDMIYTFAAYGGLAVLRAWVQNGMKESPEKIAKFIEEKVML